MSNEKIEFDEKAASEVAARITSPMLRSMCSRTEANHWCMHIARWQFEQDRKLIDGLKAEKEKLKSFLNTDVIIENERLNKLFGEVDQHICEAVVTILRKWRGRRTYFWRRTRRLYFICFKKSARSLSKSRTTGDCRC